MGKNAKKAPMNICVCGWYYDSQFMEMLTLVDYPVFVVCHRPGKFQGLNNVLIDNIGLEWGAYDYYIKNVWDRKSNIFFCHDDIRVSEPSVFNDIANLDVGLVFIFKDAEDAMLNKGDNEYPAHGRMLFMKSYLANAFLDIGGFPYDKNNTGDIVTAEANNGITNFLKEITRNRVKVGVAYYPQFTAAWRGNYTYLLREVGNGT